MCLKNDGNITYVPIWNVNKIQVYRFPMKENISEGNVKQSNSNNRQLNKYRTTEESIDCLPETCGVLRSINEEEQ